MPAAAPGEANAALDASWPPVRVSALSPRACAAGDGAGDWRCGLVAVAGAVVDAWVRVAVRRKSARTWIACAKNWPKKSVPKWDDIEHKSYDDV